MGSASAVAGLSVPAEFLRLDVLGELGVNSYAAVGSNFLRQDPGTSASLPFAGARAALLARVFVTRRGEEVWMGPSIQYAKDLHSTNRSYTYHYEGADWFSGEYHDEWRTNSVRIGQSRTCYLMTVGVTVSP